MTTQKSGVLPLNDRAIRWSKNFLRYVSPDTIPALGEWWRKSGGQNTTLADCVLSTSDATISISQKKFSVAGLTN